MITDTYMSQLNMIGVMDFHSTYAALTIVIVPAVLQISMKAVSVPTGVGCLFRSPIIDEINKIVG